MLAARCFIVGRTYVFGRRFVLRAAGKFFLGAAFGLLALLFQSLHFLLAFQKRVAIGSPSNPNVSWRYPDRFVGDYQRGSRGWRGASR